MTDIITSKRSSRLMSSYRDQIVNPHYNSEYRRNVQNFPNIFSKQNGEFTTYASVKEINKSLLSKTFSPKKV